MRYFAVFLLFFIMSGAVLAQEFPDADLPDLGTAEPFPELEEEDDDSEAGNDGLAGYINGLPLANWAYQLREIRETLDLNPDYERPVFIQYIGDGFGFVFWINNNREALFGAFAPLFYNILIFVGWALSAALIYIAVTLASAIKRVIQDFLSASIRIVQAIGEFIPF